MNRTYILATGTRFIGQGIRSTEPVIEEIISEAKKEIHVAAYVFTRSAGKMIDLLEVAAEKGVRITIVVDNLESQREPVRGRLLKMAGRNQRVNVCGFSDERGGHLHAKVVVADRSRAVMGSANFTKGGLINNYEIGVLMEGDNAWRLAELVDILAGVKNTKGA